MKPAYDIPLTDEQLKMLGEICAIQGQIETSMQSTTAALLGITMEMVRSILGSTSLRPNTEIWLRVLEEKCPLPEARDVARDASKEIATVVEGRNDFVHSVFSTRFVFANLRTKSGAFVFDNLQRVVATRVRTGKSKPVTGLKAVRDAAARISCMIAHVDWLARGKAEPSPWRGRF